MTPRRAAPRPVYEGRQAARQPFYVLPGTVYDAAYKRIRWLFEEFDGQVAASCSGGKDSTIVVEIAARVARDLGCPPLSVQFLDQEAEYASTIDYMRYLASRTDEIDLRWYQIPFRLFNATSHTEEWSHVWDPRLPPEEWIRPKEPTSIHVNDFRAGGHVIDRFKKLLVAINDRVGGAHLTGVRMEESPTRRTFLTNHPSYKWTTWSASYDPPPGSPHPHGTAIFHPIYDWSYRDVWRAIHDNGWRYNTFYDTMFRMGADQRSTRVSSFHHEQSSRHLDYLQVVEPDTWERATRRLPGISTYGHIGRDVDEYYLTHLPGMFASWEDYLDYLIENLVTRPDDRETFRRMIPNALAQVPWVPREVVVRQVLRYVMGNDVYGTKLEGWLNMMRHPDQRTKMLAATAASTASRRFAHAGGRTA